MLAKAGISRGDAEYLLRGSGVALPAFAGGGDHLGGARIVGEVGAELEFTGPSRIVNARETAEVLGSGGQLLDAVNGLGDRLERLISALAQSNDASLRAAAQAIVQGTAEAARSNTWMQRNRAAAGVLG